MNFTKKTIWNECERVRLAKYITSTKLSTCALLGCPSSLYATRRNRNDGGMTIPFTILQYLGLNHIKLFKSNLQTNQIIETIIQIKDKSIENIIEQLVYAVSVFAVGINLTELPQTIRRAIKSNNISKITMYTFEKAFHIIDNVEMLFCYNDIEEDMFE